MAAIRGSLVVRDPYPLQWPEGWARTPHHKRAVPKFIDRFAIDRKSVLHQIRRLMGGWRVVITSNLPVRGDGLPYANAPKMTSDPGIAIYWVDRRGRERVIACDRWRTPGQNLRAIDMSIIAIRGLDRWGATEMVERAFAGFAALPAGDGTEYGEALPPCVRPWREILGVDVPPYTELDGEDLMVVAKARYRKLIQDAHPDRGGDAEIAHQLNVAIGAAEEELQPSAAR